MPSEDVPGADLPGLPRYPGSIRTEYEHETQSALVVTRVEYLVRAELDAVREFYRDTFRSEGWTVADFDFSEEGKWTFSIVHGEREASVGLKAHGEVVAIEIELSEPRPEEENTLEPTTIPTPPAQGPVVDPGSGAPTPSQTPAPSAPIPSPSPLPAPAPSVGGDDDLGEDAPFPVPAPTPFQPPDDDGGGDDDGEGGDD